MHSTLEKRVRRGVLAGALAGALALSSGCAVLDYATIGTPNQQRLEYEIWKDKQARQQGIKSPINSVSQEKGWRFFTANFFENSIDIRGVKDNFSVDEPVFVVGQNEGSLNSRLALEVYNFRGELIKSERCEHGPYQSIWVDFPANELKVGEYTYSVYNQNGFIGKGTFKIFPKENK